MGTNAWLKPLAMVEKRKTSRKPASFAEAFAEYQP
jgi:hypothetical protein